MCPHDAPKVAAGLCAACVRSEGRVRKPFAAIAIDALEACGWADLAREVSRRMGLYGVDALPFEDGPRYEGMLQ
jgi:hypothetical protein